MTEERSIDELGPVDYFIVEFPEGRQNFDGKAIAELVKLHDAGIIRIMDMLVMIKDDDGAVEAEEISNLPDLGELQRIEEQLVETLAADDVATLASVMQPGSVAGVLVYENLWAAPFASALRHAGAQLVSSGRIPIQAIAAAIEADMAAEQEGV